MSINKIYWLIFIIILYFYMLIKKQHCLLCLFPTLQFSRQNESLDPMATRWSWTRLSQ